MYLTRVLLRINGDKTLSQCLARRSYVANAHFLPLLCLTPSPLLGVHTEPWGTSEGWPRLT